MFSLDRRVGLSHGRVESKIKDKCLCDKPELLFSCLALLYRTMWQGRKRKEIMEWRKLYSKLMDEGGCTGENRDKWTDTLCGYFWSHTESREDHHCSPTLLTLGCRFFSFILFLYIFCLSLSNLPPISLSLYPPPHHASFSPWGWNYKWWSNKSWQLGHLLETGPHWEASFCAQLKTERLLDSSTRQWCRFILVEAFTLILMHINIPFGWTFPTAYFYWFYLAQEMSVLQLTEAWTTNHCITTFVQEYKEQRGIWAENMSSAGFSMFHRCWRYSFPLYKMQHWRELEVKEQHYFSCSC